MSILQDKNNNPDESTAIYRRIFSYLKPHKVPFICAVLAMVVYGTTDGFIPLILKGVLDDIFSNKNESMLWKLVIAIVAFSFVRGFFGFVQRYLSLSVSLKVIRDIRNQISEKLLSFSPSFYDKHSTGTLISRMTNDTLVMQNALTNTVAGVLRDGFRIFGLLCSAIYLDPILGLICAVVFPLGVLPVIRFGKKVRAFSRKGQQQLGGLTSTLHEMIIGNRVIQSFVAEDKELRRFVDENEHFTKTYQRSAKYESLSAPSNEILASFAIAAVLVYGGMSVIEGTRTQGQFIAFITAMLLLYEPIKKGGRLSNLMQTGRAAAERIFEILDTESDIKDPAQPKAFPNNLEIAYRNVSFLYNSENEQVRALNNVSLNIRPGQTLALVGPSGGGKSTLVNLLPRFYDPQEGQITLGGVDIRELKLADLRRNISVVSQHTFLFNDTVFNNIAYGLPFATEDQVFAAARAANAHDFIQKLPDGYQSVIGELGHRLSGGERARIAIARAILKDSAILVLDEATASLDSESEKFVQEAIDRLVNGRTVLVIAHRLATIIHADCIAVVSSGQIVELGSHAELISKNGTYAKLYNIQFRSQELGVAQG